MAVMIVAIGEGAAPAADFGRHDDVDHVRVERTGAGGSVVHERWVGGERVGTGARSWEPFSVSAVADWILSVVDVAEDGRIGVLFPEREAGLTAALVSKAGLDYWMCFGEEQYNSSILRLENGAAGCAVASEPVAAEWRRRHLVPATVVDPADAATVLGAIGDGPREPGDSAPAEDGDVLLVSYFGRPSTPVSTIRLGYWADELPSIGAESGDRLTTAWLSSTRLSTEFENTIYVRDPGDVAYGIHDDHTLNEMRRRGLATIGASWELAVREAVSEWDVRFDTVVISVGPFGYVGLAEFFKHHWDARVIIDFRDPMAGDTRLSYTTEQRAWMAEHERASVRHADAILSVNRSCLDVIAPGEPVDRYVVANGFDERVPRGRRHGGGAGTTKIVYTGTIFRELPLDRVIDALDASRFELVHYGRDNSELQLVGVAAGTRSGGFVTDVAELASLVADSDLGIVRTTGEATTQTTKIFDYLGAGIEILIVTDGAPRTGALHELTDGVEGVHWVRNDPQELRQFFLEYVPTRPDPTDRDRFSRRHQAAKLVGVIRGEHPEAPVPASPGVSTVADDSSAATERLLGLEADVDGLVERVAELEREVARVARGHASNARSIRGHAALLSKLEERINGFRIDRQLRRLPARGARVVKRRMGSRPGRVGDDASPGELDDGAPASTLLVVANAYPMGRGTYGGQPIARRVRFYRRAGYDVVVFVPTTAPETRDVLDDVGTRVVVAPAHDLTRVAAQVRPTVLAVHSPVPETWNEVEGLTEEIPTIAWIHGFEARDWRELSFDFTAAQIERQGPYLDAVNVERRQLLRSLFTNQRIDVVFVSEYMRSVAERFVGQTAECGHVIHNVIDPELFPYRERSADERLRITSVRSFDKRNYGTDMIAKVFLDLRDHPAFDRLSLSIVGTGRFLRGDVAPLESYENVTVDARVMPPAELAAQLDRHGVALVPTRWDSQGMIMGEAMSTGAVPVTNAVAAIPEFVDDAVAVLGGPNDHTALAAGIARLLDEPEAFLERSRAAHDRVIEQCGPDATVRRELDLFDKVML